MFLFAVASVIDAYFLLLLLLLLVLMLLLQYFLFVALLQLQHWDFVALLQQQHFLRFQLSPPKCPFIPSSLFPVAPDPPLEGLPVPVVERLELRGHVDEVVGGLLEGVIDKGGVGGQVTSGQVVAAFRGEQRGAGLKVNVGAKDLVGAELLVGLLVLAVDVRV